MLGARHEDESLGRAGRLVDCPALLRRNREVVGAVHDQHRTVRPVYLAHRVEGTVEEIEKKFRQPGLDAPRLMSGGSEGADEGHGAAGRRRGEVGRDRRAERNPQQRDELRIDATLPGQVAQCSGTIEVERRLAERRAFALAEATIIEQQHVETERLQKPGLGHIVREDAFVAVQQQYGDPVARRRAGKEPAGETDAVRRRKADLHRVGRHLPQLGGNGLLRKEGPATLQMGKADPNAESAGQRGERQDGCEDASKTGHDFTSRSFVLVVGKVQQSCSAVPARQAADLVPNAARCAGIASARC